MLVDLIRVFLWLLVCMLVGIIEYFTGLPILTVTVIMLAVLSFPTIWFIAFVSLITLLLASLFLESWLLLWLIVMTTALIFRLPSTKSQQTLLTKVSVVVSAALILSLIREPTVTLSFLIHSLLSLIISGYLLWRKIMPKSRGLDIAELRFMAEE